MRFALTILATSLGFFSIAQASLSVNPNSLMFGRSRIHGNGPTQNLQITNTENRALRVHVQDNGCLGNFVPMGSCEVILQQGQSCSMQIQFRPQSVGLKTCSLIVQDERGGNTLVNMTGEGIDPKAMPMTLPTQYLD